MVFKGRFFSSKKSDSSSNNSPDGSSNSPRSFGSNSPSRSDKKKPKSAPKEDPQHVGGGGFSASCRQTQVKDGSSKKKDVKGKESQSQRSTPLKPSSVGSGTSSSPVPKKVASVADVQPSPSSVSPILASSLGLNRIKTRSGPLPQESFFGFRGDKVSGLGTSNLSRPGGGGGFGSGIGGKKEVASHSRMAFLDNAATGKLVDNGSNSDSMSTGSVPSRDQSPNVLAPSRLQSGESSSEAGTRFCIISSF